MRHLFVSLLAIALGVLMIRPLAAEEFGNPEPVWLHTELSPFESPEEFAELWDRYGGDGALAEPVADEPTPTVDAPALSTPVVESASSEPVAETDDAIPAAELDAAVKADTARVGDDTAAVAADPVATTNQSTAAPIPPAEITPPPLRTLTPEMQRLRDRVRYRVGEQLGHDYNVNTNTATDVLYYCLGFGRRAGVRTSNGSRPVSGVGCLCFNYAFRGYRPLSLEDGHPVGRVGYGRQAYPSQLFAVLAQARVPPAYPVRVGGVKAKVGDLVEYEKYTCRETSDMSLKLIGLSHYVTSDQTWETADGQTWTLDRVVRAEMDRPFAQASGSGVHRLMGLSHAVRRRIKDELPVDGGFARAQSYLDKFHDHALNLQNPDGSWHPRAFRVRGVSRDTAGTLRATGMILNWLVYSLPDDRLDDPRVIRSVTYLTNLLGNQRYAAHTSHLPTNEIAGVMHAVHALRLYDQRVFQPADPRDEVAAAAGGENRAR